MKKFSTALVFLAFLTVIAVLFIALPKSDFSANEKRVLSQFPEVSFDSITDGSFGSGLETYLADHFPLREQLVGVDSYMKLLSGRNGDSGIYAGFDGYLIAAPDAFHSNQAEKNIRRLAEFAKTADLPATLITVPTAGYILDEKLPSNHLPYFDDALFSLIEANASPMKTVDLRTEFQASEEQLYYRTDHHLTSAGAYRMYRQFCDAVGIEAKAFACAERSEGFFGTGYSKSGLWLTEPDTLEIWVCDQPSSYRVTIHEDGGETVSDSLYFPAHLSEPDQYPVFLDGNHSLVTIENQSCRNGRRLLLIKDSYAHCFATFTAEHYEQITMVDLRYYKEPVSELIQEYDLNEILVLYGAENLAASTDINWLS